MKVIEATSTDESSEHVSSNSTEFEGLNEDDSIIGHDQIRDSISSAATEGIDHQGTPPTVIDNERWHIESQIRQEMGNDLALNHSVNTALLEIDHFFVKNGYDDFEICVEVGTDVEDPQTKDCLIRVLLDIADVDEWIELEDAVQNIVLKSEEYQTELYGIVERDYAR